MCAAFAGHVWDGFMVCWCGKCVGSGSVGVGSVYEVDVGIGTSYTSAGTFLIKK